MCVSFQGVKTRICNASEYDNKLGFQNNNFDHFQKRFESNKNYFLDV